MTTYYGVWLDWSGRDGPKWWQSKGELFHTPLLGIARAQAMVANAAWRSGPAYGTRKDEHWEVRTIGEDGLPEPGPLTEEQQAWGASYFTPGRVSSEEA